MQKEKTGITSLLFSVALVAGVVLLFTYSEAQARDWYVSINRGKGKKGTIEKPAKDLGNIIKKLAPGDVIHIAEGVYTGKGDNGSDQLLVPVSIIGGYDDTFAKRDPWGAHKTILSGDVKTKNWVQGARLHIDLSKYREDAMPPIKVDGLILDNANRNRYASEKQHSIVRAANPKTGENPTPDRGGLVITVSKGGVRAPADASWKITVQNCIVMNHAPTQGALQVAGHKNSEIFITNNLVINNTGIGIYASTMYHGADKFPRFTIKNNTVLFTWKYDAMAQSFSGTSLRVSSSVVAEVTDNVFAFADRIGIQKEGQEPLLLANNIITGNLYTDYWETADDARIALEDLEDEAEYLHDDSEENLSEAIKTAVSEEWAALYMQRVLIDRNKLEADIKATNSDANALRGMLGLPLQAGEVKGESSPVWLHRLSIDDAIGTGSKRFSDSYGCCKPENP